MHACVKIMSLSHIDLDLSIIIINPWCMREGYGSRSVCVSATKLATTYLICKSKVQLYKVPYGVPNACQ